MRRTLLPTALWAALGGAAVPHAGAGQPVVTPVDSAWVLRAVWDVVAAGWGARETGPVLWLWAPAVADSGRVVPLSPALRTALTRRGIPAGVRRPAGDDTVVFRITGWRAAPDGADVEVVSAWTTVLAGRTRACRAGSGNVERLRVRRREGRWTAERAGPVLHGDDACVPVP